jgi:DNA ligase-associated metallophosphoesterase
VLNVQKKISQAIINGSWGSLHLLAERAVWWPEQAAILVADLHLGKEATFQQSGISVPAGTSEKTLNRLTLLISKYRPNVLYILGDLFHARSSLSDRVTAAMDRFISAHPDLAASLIRGNHDRHLGELPLSWNLQVIESALTVGTVTMTHFPQPARRSDQLVIAGHLHPAVRLNASMGMPGKLACFWLTATGCLTVPAFGEFVGSMKVDISDGDKIWLPIGESVLSVPANALV